MHEVWVTGIGILTAIGSGQKCHLSALKESKTGLSNHTIFHQNGPVKYVCGLIPSEYIDQNLDKTAHNRADLILEQTLKQVLQYMDQSTGKFNADLIIGTTAGNMHGGTRYYKEYRGGNFAHKNLLHHFLPCAPVEFIADKYCITGKTLTIASACGSASAAIGQAFHRIRSGRSNCVIAGGFEALSPFMVAGFNSLQLVSKKECKPFDINRNGLNPGEGSALLLLESEESARKRNVRPIAKVKGFGDAVDGYHFTRAHPEGKGLISAIKKAMNSAWIEKDKIDTIHSHGTATLINDSSEYSACSRIFRQYLSEIPVCSTKSITGHTFGASGALNAVFSIISIKNNLVPATLFHETLDPEFSGLSILKKPEQKYSIQNILSLSLGFGGEAYALIISGVEN
ncbi:MAG: beta-ketoacyl-[acyl-carrier-protein] synthase family protein [Chitinispirillia bacterium]|jgi:3-oxoacyl-(acyl-carrier-protein) synthase